MQRENPLHSNSVGDLPHSEGRSNSPSLPTNHHSFEGLHPLLLSLHNLHMDLYRIPHLEILEVCPQLFSFNQFHCIHTVLLFTQFRNAPSPFPSPQRGRGWGEGHPHHIFL